MQGVLKNIDYNLSYLDSDFTVSPEVINTKFIANVRGHSVGLAETSSYVQ